MTSVAPRSEARGGRWVHLQGAANVRDLGGLPTLDGRRTTYGVLLRADNLQGLTPEDVRLLVGDLGVRTVVDLRTDGERTREGPGPLASEDVDHHHHSLVPEDGTRLPESDERILPDRTEQRPEDVYLGYLDDAATEIADAVRALATGEGAAIFHCAAGKDRTGVLAALMEGAVGVTREGILVDYLATAEVLPAVMARLSASPTYADDVADTPLDAHLPRVEVMTGVLDALDAGWGGPRGWLLAHGLDEATLDALERRLVG